MMRCIKSCHHHSLFYPQLKTKQNQHQLSKHNVNRQLIPTPKKQPFSSLKTKAMHNTSLLLAVAENTPAKGDLSVILQAGGVLFIVYFISNFIVPEFIAKSYASEEASEDKKDSD